MASVEGRHLTKALRKRGVGALTSHSNSDETTTFSLSVSPTLVFRQLARSLCFLYRPFQKRPAFPFLRSAGCFGPSRAHWQQQFGGPPPFPSVRFPAACCSALGGAAARAISDGLPTVNRRAAKESTAAARVSWSKRQRRLVVTTGQPLNW